MSSQLTTGGLSLDHIGYVGADLTNMIRAAGRLGLAPTEPEALLAHDSATGRAVSLQQRSCHVVMPGSYIELTSVASEDPRHHLAAWRSRGDGAHILALGADDLEAVHRQCAAAGLRPTPIAEATRPIRYGATQGDARFDWFMLPATVFSAVLLCVVRNRTPALVYQSEVMSHPLRAVALEEVALVVSQPARVQAGQLGWAGDARQPEPEVCEIALRTGRLTLLTPQAASRRWSEPFDGTRWSEGGMAAVTLRVADLGLAERLLQSAGLRFVRDRDELRVASRDANGAVLVLRS